MRLFFLYNVSVMSSNLTYSLFFLLFFIINCFSRAEQRLCAELFLHFAFITILTFVSFSPLGWFRCISAWHYHRQCGQPRSAWGRHRQRRENGHACLYVSFYNSFVCVFLCCFCVCLFVCILFNQRRTKMAMFACMCLFYAAFCVFCAWCMRSQRWENGHACF